MSIIRIKFKNNSKCTVRLIFILSLFFVLSILNGSLNAEEIQVESYVSDSTEIRYLDSFQLKSESHAFKLSLWATVGPLPTLYFAIPGIVFGPSLGYFYADMPGRAWRGIGIRSLGVVGMGAAFAWGLSDLGCHDCGNNSNSTTVGILFFSSAGVIVFSAIYDIATVKKVMRKKKVSMLQSNFNIEPSYFADSKSYGLRLNLRF